MDVLGFVTDKPCKSFMAVRVSACSSYKYFPYFFREKIPKVTNKHCNLRFQSNIDKKNQCYFPALVRPIVRSEKPLSKVVEAFYKFSIISIRNNSYLNPEGHIASFENFTNGFSRLSEPIFSIIANQSNSTLSFSLGVTGIQKSLIWFSSG